MRGAPGATRKPTTAGFAGGSGREKEGPDTGRGREEAAQAQAAAAALAGEGEAGAFVALLVQDDQVLALGDAGEVAVDGGRFEEVVGLQAFQPAPQSGAAVRLHQFLVAGAGAGAGLLQSPLALEQ